MAIAQQRDAVRQGNFYFRKTLGKCKRNIHCVLYVKMKVTRKWGENKCREGTILTLYKKV